MTEREVVFPANFLPLTEPILRQVGYNLCRWLLYKEVRVVRGLTPLPDQWPTEQVLDVDGFVNGAFLELFVIPRGLFIRVDANCSWQYDFLVDRGAALAFNEGMLAVSRPYQDEWELVQFWLKRR